jgi:hypothetical protein
MRGYTEVTLQISGKIADFAFGSPAFGTPLFKGGSGRIY